jgi:hypothetical protein
LLKEVVYVLVNPSAVVPDLAAGAREWRDVVSKEGGLATNNVGLDLCVGGPTVVEHLVRV